MTDRGMAGSADEVPLGCVLAGVDGSTHALAAVRWAAEEAVSRDKPLAILHAADYLTHSSSGPRERQRARAVVAKAFAEATAHALVEPETVVVEQNPAPALVAASSRAEVLVLGMTGAGGVDEILLGSTTLAVSGRARCPVVGIRRWPLPEDNRRYVLLGVGSARADAAAIEAAFDLASRRKKPLVAVHAESPLLTGNSRKSEDETTERLAEELSVWRHRYPEVSVECRVSRRAATNVLLELSEHAEATVVGNHGRGLAARALLGSTSRTVLRYSTSPVIVAGAMSIRPSSPAWVPESASDPHEPSQLW